MTRFKSLRQWAQSILRWCFSTPPVRRARVRAAATCAAYVTAAVQVLESRVLLAGHGVDIDVAPNAAVPGQYVEIAATYSGESGSSGQRGSGDFADYFGQALIGPTNIGIDNPVDGFWNGESFEIFGSHNGQAASVPVTGGDVTLFDSFLSENGGEGDKSGVIAGAAVTPQGIVYTGQTAGVSSSALPTAWKVSTSPSGGIGPSGLPDPGSFIDIDSNGIMVGTTGTPFYGVFGEVPAQLPGTNATVSALDISQNSSYIAGDLLWISDGNGGYNILSIAGFDFEDTGTPDWQGVEVDASGEVFFAGEFFSFDTFTTHTAFWDGDGKLLGSGEGIFGEFAVVNGDVVAAVNTPDEGIILRVRDMASVSVEDLTGSPAFFNEGGSFYASSGALGLILEDDDGEYTTVIQTAGGGGNDPVVAALHFDCDGDGDIDVIKQGSQGSIAHAYSEAGTYTIEVIAVDEDGNEMARESIDFTVEPFVVAEVSGENVLFVGARPRGSSIRVFGFAGGFSVSVDRDRGFVDADRVVIYGSERNDRVSLYGSFTADAYLYGGNDSLTSIGASVHADFGDGNNRGTAIGASEVAFIGGADRDRFSSIRHGFALLDGGGGNDSLISLGDTALLIGGDGRDSLISLDDYSVLITDELQYTPLEVDTVMEELGSGAPDFDFLGSILDPLTIEDDDRDSGLLWALDGLLIDGDRDRVRSFNRRR